MLARDSFGFIELHGEIDALDNKIPSAVQLELYLAVQNLVRQQTVWFLRNVSVNGDLAQYVGHYRDGLQAIEKAFDKVLPEAALKGLEADQKALIARKVPKDVAQKITHLQHLSRAPDVILVAAQSKKPVEDVARVFYGLGASLNLDRIAAGAGAIPVVDYFERLAVNRTLESIFASQRGLSAQILAEVRVEEECLGRLVRQEQPFGRPRPDGDRGTGVRPSDPGEAGGREQSSAGPLAHG